MPVNLKYPSPVCWNVKIVFGAAVTVLSLNAKFSTLTAPVPVVVREILVSGVLADIELLLITIEPT